MEYSRLNEYRTMWLMIFFDLPTETKQNRKDYSGFRKLLISDGFSMFQYSIYIRPCASKENAVVHINRIIPRLPSDGKICIMTITDKQFGDIKIFEGRKSAEPLTRAIQLELF